MATILIDGLAIEALHLVCEPPAGNDSKTPCQLRVRSRGADYTRFVGTVPVAFPYEGKLYYGTFLPAGRMCKNNGEEECEFISDGKVTPCMEPQDRATHRAEPWDAKEDEATRLRKRLEVERELARLARAPVGDPTFAFTAVFIVAAVALAAIVAALFVAMH